MYKVSLMDHSDLKEAYEIEKQTNPSPWSKENFFSSYEVGHKSLVCRIDNIIVGFIIFSVIKKEIHLLNIAVHIEHQKKGHWKFINGNYAETSKRDGSFKSIPRSKI